MSRWVLSTGPRSLVALNERRAERGAGTIGARICRTCRQPVRFNEILGISFCGPHGLGWVS